MGIGYAGAYSIPRVDLGEAFQEYMFSLEQFIGMRLFTTMDVNRKEAQFAKITRENQLRNENLRRSAGSAYSRGTFEGEDDNYRCEEYGFESPLDDSERALYANDFDAEDEATKLAFWKLMIAYEIRVSTIMQGADFTVANGRRTDVAIAWTAPQADIIQDVLGAVETVRARVGMKPDTFWCASSSIRDLIVNQGIRDSIVHTQRPTVAEVLGALASLFDVRQIVIGGQVQNTALEGQAAVIADVWGARLWAGVCITAPAGSGLRSPCVGRTIYWRDDSPSDVTVEEYREEQVRSTIYRARHNVDEKLMDTSYAQLLDIAG